MYIYSYERLIFHERLDIYLHARETVLYVHARETRYIFIHARETCIICSHERD